MCQYCLIDECELLMLPAGEEGFCEYCTEDVPPCGEDAPYAHKFRYVDEHLCEDHMRETSKDLKEGLMDFQESLGFSTAVAIKKIEPGETCEYAVLPDFVDCGKPAGYVMINTALTPVCEKHKDMKD